MKNRPDPSSPEAPKYWMHEMGGELAPAMMQYLLGGDLADGEVLLIRAYLLQWINSPAWDANPAMDPAGRLNLAGLRSAARFLRDRADIDIWLKWAAETGMDPL